jgi:hypothetical protein
MVLLWGLQELEAQLAELNEQHLDLVNKYEAAEVSKLWMQCASGGSLSRRSYSCRHASILHM